MNPHTARDSIGIFSSVPVISLKMLRQNKAASGRPKDLGDLSELPDAP